MATFSELKPHHRVFVSSYPFSRFAVKDNPAAGIQKPLNECRFALVTTGGILRPGDERFRNTLKLGDTSYREIPNDVEVHNLIEGHKSTAAEHTGIERDINLAFPIERFREMEKEGAIGPLNHRHFSFMGSIISPRGLIKTTAPQVAGMLKEDRVDAVFLTPVWPFCVQAVGLIAAEIERHSIPTTSISLSKEISAVIRPPRALVVPYPFGYPLGEAGNPALQRRIIDSALSLLIRGETPILEEFAP